MMDTDDFEDFHTAAPNGLPQPEQLDMDHPSRLQLDIAVERLRQELHDALLTRHEQLKAERGDFPPPKSPSV